MLIICFTAQTQYLFVCLIAEYPLKCLLTVELNGKLLSNRVNGFSFDTDYCLQCWHKNTFYKGTVSSLCLIM